MKFIWLKSLKKNQYYRSRREYKINIDHSRFLTFVVRIGIDYHGTDLTNSGD